MEDNKDKQVKREIRSVAQAPVSTEGRRIEGYAIVFNEPSLVMNDWWNERSFTETISPEAVTDELIRKSDVLALYEHDSKMLLARSCRGEGTLTLTKDERGLKYSFEAPDTTYGNNLLELVKRGDIKGSSFAFTVDDEGSNMVLNSETNIWERTITKISGLYDVSPVATPAYTATSVSARSLEGPKEEPEERNTAYKAQLDKIRLELNNL